MSENHSLSMYAVRNENIDEWFFPLSFAGESKTCIEEKEKHMSELKKTTCKTLKENLTQYSLLEILHHEVGNGLAVISGYTQMLQRARFSSSSLESEASCAYLTKLEQRMVQLNEFLTHIRKFVFQPSDTRFCEKLITTDLAILVQQVFERLAPLYAEKPIEVHFPSQQLCVRCDVLWIEFVLEHVLSHNMAFHEGPSSLHLTLECHKTAVQERGEARMGIHICMRHPKRSHVTRSDIFGSWSQTLDQHDQDICMSLCEDILQMHGGRIWSELKSRRMFSMYIALPLSVMSASSSEPVVE
ncbi:hypothetical protein [Ktedonospora formicarum]|uniref:Uncharacterized protein n=1 Tax=Ktedonospora formicarum TaxID=2778364 RepID=A0A8J3I3Y5_9CHLR|nr:hypothetical protein [Ktedonospora formicarum]GHO47101.1 hypothetical protein KSX_52640 [Ktedonospora formicarum]